MSGDRIVAQFMRVVGAMFSALGPRKNSAQSGDKGGDGDQEREDEIILFHFVFLFGGFGANGCSLVARYASFFLGGVGVEMFYLFFPFIFFLS